MLKLLGGVGTALAITAATALPAFADESASVLGPTLCPVGDDVCARAELLREIQFVESSYGEAVLGESTGAPNALAQAVQARIELLRSIDYMPVLPREEVLGESTAEGQNALDQAVLARIQLLQHGP